MRKLIVTLLIAVTVLGLTACGEITESVTETAEKTALAAAPIQEKTLDQWAQILGELAEAGGFSIDDPIVDTDNGLAFFPVCNYEIFLIAETADENVTGFWSVMEMDRATDDIAYAYGYLVTSIVETVESDDALTAVLTTMDLDHAFTGDTFSRVYDDHGSNYKFTFDGEQWYFSADWDKSVP